MNKQEKDTLEKQLQSLASNERNRLFKRAAQMRKLAQTKNNTRPRRAVLVHDDEDEIEVAHRQPQSSLHEWALKLLAMEEVEEGTEGSRAGTEGTVIAIGPRSAEVMMGEELLICTLAPELAEKQQTEIAVGDVVLVDRIGEHTAVVEEVRPRRTKLSRPDPGKSARERVIVANVDVVVVVASVVSPPLHPRILDRYLIAIRRGGAEAVIAVNKIDLASEDERREELSKLEPYAGLGVPIIPASADRKIGIEELRSHLTGKLSAFVGHSGVGKSSLLNALKPDLHLQTGAVSDGYGRGTHTTTRSTLWHLGDGTRIIDTPGIRSFGLWNLSREELPWYFPEFAAVGRCKFRDCTHIHEPGCSVKEALENGELSPDRYSTYLRILESL